MIAALLIIIIRGLRPLLGPPARCCYEVGCTQFAIDQLKTVSFYTAIYRIVKRVLSCNPFMKNH